MLAAVSCAAALSWELDPSCLGEGASPSTHLKEICPPGNGPMCLYPMRGFHEGKAQPGERRGELFQ